MARQPRVIIPDQPVHIMHRGNNRQDIFLNDDDRQRFLQYVGTSLNATGCKLHAYVLMTNHFHFLLTPPNAEALSCFMQALGRHYVRYFNGEYKRSGTLWEGRYKSSLIDSDAYLLTCYRYIEDNPVRAGMVASAEQHAWSSYRYNGLGESDSLITEHLNYSQLAKEKTQRLTVYKGFFSEIPLKNDEIKLITQSVDRGQVLGKKGFTTMVESVTGIKSLSNQHGGDRKSKAFQELSFK